MAAFFGRPIVRIAVLGVALIWALLTLAATIEYATAVAACGVRAEYELILCASPPEAWVLPAVVAIVVGSSLLIGAELARHR